MTDHCCEAMDRRVNVSCDLHDDPFACPDSLITFSAKFQEYGLIIHDGGTASITIDFCPWCGRRLPESQRDRWFDELECRGIDPWQDEVPVEFQDDRWLAAPSGTSAVYRHSVSVKGVCVRDGRVLLLRNERDEWELPGGKLESGEAPDACVAREITEETGWPVRVGDILDSWQYRIRDRVDVLIVTYGCHVDTDAAAVVSHEHKEVGLFTRDQIDGLRMPQGYKASVHNWFTRLDLLD